MTCGGVEYGLGVSIAAVSTPRPYDASRASMLSASKCASYTMPLLGSNQIVAEPRDRNRDRVLRRFRKTRGRRDATQRRRKDLRRAVTRLGKRERIPGEIRRVRAYAETRYEHHRRHERRVHDERGVFALRRCGRRPHVRCRNAVERRVHGAVLHVVTHGRRRVERHVRSRCVGPSERHVARERRAIRRDVRFCVAKIGIRECGDDVSPSRRRSVRLRWFPTA